MAWSGSCFFHLRAGPHGYAERTLITTFNDLKALLLRELSRRFTELSYFLGLSRQNTSLNPHFQTSFETLIHRITFPHVAFLVENLTTLVVFSLLTGS